MIHTTFKDPIAGKILIHTSPKVGSTSIRKWLYHMVEGRPWYFHWNPMSSEPEKVRRYRETMALMQWCSQKRVAYTYRLNRVGPEPGVFNVAIHRNPCDRLFSYYQALVDDHENVSRLSDWLKRIHVWRAESEMANLHTMPQSAFLGACPSDYQMVLPLSHLSLLSHVLSQMFDREMPEIGKHNTHPISQPVSREAMELARAYGAHDELLGWNGRTMLLPVIKGEEALRE
jgi:hypothetical protein